MYSSGGYTCKQTKLYLSYSLSFALDCYESLILGRGAVICCDGLAFLLRYSQHSASQSRISFRLCIGKKQEDNITNVWLVF